MLTSSTWLRHDGFVPRKLSPRQIFPPRGYHHGNLRAALIEAGLKLIEEQGVRALTLREIGNRAGVSRMAAYRHFANKEALLSAISEAGFVEFAAALESAREQAGMGCEARLAAMAVAYVRFAAEHWAHFEVMFGSGGRSGAAPGGAAAKRAFDALEQTIREGQENGEVRPGNSIALAQAAWALVHGISTLGMEGGARGLAIDATFTRMCSDFLWSGLAAHNE
ncbi:MAG: TetR/AcrR family transcriptional regulator [Acidobacteriaceae bacterium]|nr:TetR/AcrR family transcriptional regulator [Acidobacteriaceae bacterium]